MHLMLETSAFYLMLVSLLLISNALTSALAIQARDHRHKKVHTLDLHHQPLPAANHNPTATRFVTYDALNRDTFIKQSALPTTVDQLVQSGIAKQNASILVTTTHNTHTWKDQGIISTPSTKNGSTADARMTRQRKGKDAAISRFDAAWDLHVGWVENAKSDSEFLLEIEVGTPPQKFLASIDTASPLTWLYTEQCCFAGNHSYFRPDRSSTFSNRTLDKYDGAVVAMNGVATQSYRLQYGGQGTGSINLNLGFDTVNILPSSKILTIKNQTVGLVQSIASAQRGQGRDLRRMEGILGLSPGNGTAIPGKLRTPVEQLILDDAIEDSMFTVSFVKVNGSENAKGGRLIIGGLDHDRMTGDVTWINSTSTLFWGFEFDQGAMRYGRIDIWPSGQTRRVTAKIVNEAIQGSYYDGIGSRWLIPCNTGTLPREKSMAGYERARYFSINLGGKLFATPTADLVLFPSSPINVQMGSDKVPMCNSAVQGGSEHFAVLGNTFIKNHAITFKYGSKDLSNRQIGFAHRSDTGIILQVNKAPPRVESEDTQANGPDDDDC